MKPDAHDWASRALENMTAWEPCGPDSRPTRPDASRCVDPAKRTLLLLYALSSCIDEEALIFEAHLIACETCFQDLKVLDRAGLLIRELMASGSPVQVRVDEALEILRLREDITSPPAQHRV